MVFFPALVIGFIVVALLSRVILDRLPRILSLRLIALINLLATATIFFAMSGNKFAFDFDQVRLTNFVIYFGLVSVFYLIVLAHKRISHIHYILPFLLPMVFLAFAKVTNMFLFMGISYMAFRMSLFVYELDSGKIELPSFLNYMGFMFFFATFLVGPISLYSDYKNSIEDRKFANADIAQIGLRFMVGVLKFTLIANIMMQMSFSGMILDGHFHHWFEFIICSITFLLFVFFNFSGLNDMSLSSTAFYGGVIKENFDRPFWVTNIQDFWERWHMSLSHFVRNGIYNPIAFMMARNFRSLPIQYIGYFALLVSFSIIGLWHGIEWRFLYYGLANAVGIIVFTMWRKVQLPSWTNASLLGIAPRNVMAGTLTITYVSLCASLVALSEKQMQKVLTKILVW